MSEIPHGRKPLEQAALLIFLLSVFALGICKVQDGDAWMHLSMGREIVNHRGFPGHEPFVYPMADKPFVYSSWLFGVIYYLAFLASGLYGVILLKALTVTAAFAILMRDSLLPRRSASIAIGVLTLIVVMVYHRFIERPDTFVMVFLPFVIFSLNAYVRENKRYIYLLPVIHVIWANSHSSINLMFVPFLAFISGGIIQRVLATRGLTADHTLSWRQILTISIVFAASFAASLISPYFISQYFWGSQFLNSPWWRENIKELKPPTWQTWKLPYLMTGLLVISFALNWKRFSITEFILSLPFVALAFTALRFGFLLCIVSGPIIARNLSSFVASMQWDRFISGTPAVAAAAAGAVFSSSLVMADVRPFGAVEQMPGFGTNETLVPEKALHYMDTREITGRVFNLFAWGGYIIWRDFPKRIVFVDPRGYIDPWYIKRMYTALQFTAVLNKLEERTGFESILIDYPAYTDVSIVEYIDHGVSHHEWALVYWDDVSLVYVKRGGRYDAVVQEDAYRFVKPANVTDTFGPRVQSDSVYRDGVLSELQRNLLQTGSARARAYLGFLYNDMGRYREAVDELSQVTESPYADLRRVYNSLADAYMNLGDLDRSLLYCRKSLSVGEDAEIFFRIGVIHQARGDRREALANLEKAFNLDPKSDHIYERLSALYTDLGMSDQAATVSQRRREATR